MSKIKDRGVVFLTIHKLLNIKKKIDKNGKELFEIILIRMKINY